MTPLVPADFPLYAVGHNVWARMRSSPLFTAASDALAEDLAFRLNRDEMARQGAGVSSDGRHITISAGL